MKYFMERKTVPNSIVMTCAMHRGFSSTEYKTKRSGEARSTARVFRSHEYRYSDLVLNFTKLFFVRVPLESKKKCVFSDRNFTLNPHSWQNSFAIR